MSEGAAAVTGLAGAIPVVTLLAALVVANSRQPRLSLRTVTLLVAVMSMMILPDVSFLQLIVHWTRP